MKHQEDNIMEIKYRKDLGKLLQNNDMVGDTCEVGCAEGFFSKDILSWNLGKHYMVDNWGCIQNTTGDGNFPDAWHEENYKKAMKRIEAEASRVVVLRGMSVVMADKIPDNSLVLVYIDANHTKEGVAADIVSYFQKLKSGGVMAFHDYESIDYGVKDAVNEFANRNNLTVHFIAEDKLEDAGAWVIKP